MLYNYMPLYSKLHLPPSANPGLSTAKPRCSHAAMHAVCTLQMLPPTLFLLMQNLSLIHCKKKKKTVVFTKFGNPRFIPLFNH